MQKEMAVRIIREMLEAMTSETLKSVEDGEFHKQIVWIAQGSYPLGIRIPKRFRQDIEIIANDPNWRSTPPPSPVVNNEKGAFRQKT